MGRVSAPILLLVAAALPFVARPALAQSSGEPTTAAGRCVTCHKVESPGLYRQWYSSEHATHGVTCYDCHRAERKEVDAFEHEGAFIATLVTPKDCSGCHEQASSEVAASYHANAGLILESKDAYLAHAAGGAPVAVAGCESCHGSKVRIDPSSPNKLAAESWPNTGIGRINPDGSKGACTACHTRHNFDKSQARRPEACSKCHLGPDHPQKEVYEASKHGNVYFTNVDKMNLDADRWVVGVDYWVAPTCATCHMSATQNQPLTHDVGQRISWTLRPVVSSHKENWEARRDNMKEVCRACHAGTFIEGFYDQYDGVVELYNEKFAKPATRIMDKVREKGLLASPAAFSNSIEWQYWELWHHEGRVARHGASMMAPDYTWWHGIYEVAHNFYFEFLESARQYDDPEVNAVISEVMKDPMHAWFNRPTDEIKRDIQKGELQKIYNKMLLPGAE